MDRAARLQLMGSIPRTSLRSFLQLPPSLRTIGQAPDVHAAIPAELRERAQWLVWREEIRNGKRTKVPYRSAVPSQRASSTDPESWSTYAAALTAPAHTDGLGFVVSDGDPYTGVDLDCCRDPDSGALTPEAAEIISLLRSYSEVSPSGEGIHIFVQGKWPGPRNATTRVAGMKKAEVYDRARFFTVTGHHLHGTPTTVEARQAELDEIYGRLFPEPPRPSAALAAVPLLSLLSLDDEELLDKARRAKNGAAFEALWRGDTGAYPSPSEADLALCGMLAFWTGPDAARIDRLVRKSGLTREKWDEQHGSATYGAMTVAKALEGRTDFYQPTVPARASNEAEPAPNTRGAVDDDRDDEDAENRSKVRDRRARESQATVLVELAAEAEIFRSTPSGRLCASFIVNGHRETWRLRGAQFQRWLRRCYYEQTGKAAKRQALEDAIGVLGAQADFGELEFPVSVRVAEHQGAIYLDLGDADWRAVEVTAAGWSIVADPPVRFRRPTGLLALAVPVHGGELAELARFVNPAEDEELLLKAALVQMVNPRGPYPVLALHGEQGSAKSTTAQVLRVLVDPYYAPLRSRPRSEHDLVIAAENSWVLAFDNLSGLADWFSDALCRLATGGGLATRELYTDDQEVIFDAQRPIILTGIEELATRGDLLDRSLVLHLPTIDEKKRRDERTFWAEFADAQPRILGALLDAAATALRRLADTQLERLPRMADFARWVTAAEPALDCQPGEFLETYTRNRSQANQITIEASLIAELVTAIAATGFEGTASELLRQLNALADEETRKRKGWPPDTTRLSGALRRIAPNLRAIGIDVSLDFRLPGTSGKKKGVRIARTPTTTDAPHTSDVSDVSDVSPRLAHPQHIPATLDDNVSDVQKSFFHTGSAADAANAAALHDYHRADGEVSTGPEIRLQTGHEPGADTRLRDDERDCLTCGKSKPRSQFIEAGTRCLDCASPGSKHGDWDE